MMINLNFIKTIVAGCVLTYSVFSIQLLSAQTLAFAQKKVDKLIITPIAKDVFVYTTFNEFAGKLFPSNSLYLVTEDGVVLIDTPWDTAQFQPLLDSIKARHGREVVMCISTHFHADRTAGLEYYNSKNIKTYSTQMTLDSCISRGEKRATNIFKNDTIFKVGQYEFEAYYPGPGHSPDNIVIWVPHAKVLFGGCFVKSTENNDLGNIADANISEWAGSMLKVEKRYPKAKIVIPGHFAWGSKKNLKHTRKLVEKHGKK
jgi:metallo-beta-lactamase class B